MESDVVKRLRVHFDNWVKESKKATNSAQALIVHEVRLEWLGAFLDELEAEQGG